MILLTSTSDKITVTTGAAGTIGVHASWVDLSGTTVTPDRANFSITSATTTDVVASPASSVTRNVKLLSVWNDGATQDVTITHTDGTTAVDLWVGSIPAQSGVVFDETCGWKIIGAETPADIQTFTFPGGRWIKPNSFTPSWVLTRVWGGGGGGGAGASLATAAVAKGGSGGGGGAMATVLFPAAILPDILTVTIGAGGLPGSPGAAGAAGNDAGNGGATSITISGNLAASVVATPAYLSVGGGVAGRGGVITASATLAGAGASAHSSGGGNIQAPGYSMIGVNASAGAATNGPAWEGGGMGGGSNSTPSSFAGGTSRFGGGGGGSGGHHNATPAVVDASAGGLTGPTVGSTVSGGGGAAGTSGATPTAGANGADGTDEYGGQGGGGGGSTVAASTDGANGGDGGRGGGGGGGGGVGMNPGLGGRGGQGGPGYGWIATW